jgi:HlyD family secretion protein
MFPVLVRIENKDGLLRPGMNSEVEIHVGRRDSVLAVPTAALRTQRDVGSAAQVLGLSPEAVQQQLAAARPRNAGTARTTSTGSRDSTLTSDSGAHTSMGASSPAGSQSPRGRSGGRSARGQAQGSGAMFIVFIKRNGQPAPVWVRTGLSDMDYSEVLEGLSPSDSVLILPSASLVQSQQDMRERFNRVTGGGAVPGMRQQTTTPSTGAGRP